MIKLISTKKELWTDFYNLGPSATVAEFASRRLWYVIECSMDYFVEDFIWWDVKLDVRNSVEDFIWWDVKLDVRNSVEDFLRYEL